MMLKIIKVALQSSPALLAATLVLANSVVAIESVAVEAETENNIAVTTTDTAIAQLQTAQTHSSEITESAQPSVGSLETLDSLEQSIEEDDAMGQVTSINQLSDVRPTDWAYEALRNLVEKYQCIAGYPDGTYRGNRAMTRYEFAAGLNACLESILRLIPGEGGFSGLATREDLEVLRRLMAEFSVELATLRGRVDALEPRIAELEANQFSTTTKLRGEIIFAANDIIGDGSSSVPNFNFRTRLNFDTSFTGKDLLRTRLQAINVPNLGTVDTPSTPMDRLSFDAGTNNNVQIHKLFYRFPLTSKATVILDANAAEYNDNMFNFNPFLESSAQGSISRFGRFSPIYRQGGGQGVTLNYDFSKRFSISLGYQAPNGNDPAFAPGGGGGFFSGSYAALGQLTFRPSERFALGFTYVNSYHSNGRNLAGGTGSSNADNPFNGVPTSANHYGIQTSLWFSPRVNLSGWVGYTKAESEVGNQDAEIWNWAVTLGLLDFGKEDNLLGFVVGMPPKVTSNDIATREDRDTSYHLEAFYRYQVSDNVSITPGLFVILNPNHNNDNTNDFVGTIRTTFTF